MSADAELVPSDGRRAARAAWIHGIARHLAFAAAVASMIAGLFGGMRSGLGRLPFAWAHAAKSALLAQFPLLNSALRTRPGHEVLKRLGPSGLGSDLASTVHTR